MATQELSVEELQAEIEKALESVGGTSPPRVTVNIRGTSVTLKGDVSTWAQHEAVDRAVWSMPGVAAVDNQVCLLVRGRRSCRS
jgi:osmotically-inducible protein OsmY